eukprot:10281983-Alexandrium_andersonii.AAC.1
MSASLVGSEMCIRDSPMVLPCICERKLFCTCLLAHLLAIPAAQTPACASTCMRARMAHFTMHGAIVCAKLSQMALNPAEATARVPGRG